MSFFGGSLSVNNIKSDISSFYLLFGDILQ